jgi:hypothetical protein
LDALPDGRPVLRKRVALNHELRTPPGVAVDEQVIEAAEREGAAGIVVERMSGETLWAPLCRWQKGIPIRRGFGPQRALLWRQLEALPGCRQASATTTHRQQQLDLFAESL